MTDLDRLTASLPPRFRVLRELGSGGMGIVVLAEQLEPVRREVAIKVLKGAHDSERVVQRFEAERQALAMMDHPSIAKVFDAGVTSDGRPYFVMEYVDGPSLTAYCDEHRLTIRERVALFADVCRGVQHAHQKGVMHRDLKPSNVLVTRFDGRPLPRIIDFGLVRATGADQVDGITLTRDDQVLGTPAYMSPEQMDGAGDIDTRTDLYSLGVLLYEVLVGALPYDPPAYRGWAAFAANLLREPPTPHQRFQGLGDTQETVARLRSTTPQGLRRQLSGDLGWITSQAMEKDRDLRYETANALALDLGRFLAHEPVRARGRSATYQARKFVRRNWAGVSLASTVAAGLIAFSITTSIQAERTARARDEADARRAQAEGLIDFMLGDLREKLEPVGRLDILDDVNDQAVAYFAAIPEDRFTDEELASRSRALYQGGMVRLEQGDLAAAKRAFEESLRMARELSERAPDDVDRLFELSQSHFYVGFAAYREGDLDAAEAQFLGYRAAAERLVEIGPDDPDYRMELGFAHGNLGSVYEARGDLAAATEAFERTLEVKAHLASLDPTDVDRLGEVAESHNKLGFVLQKRGRYEEALAHHATELDLRRRVRSLQPDHAPWRYRSAVALGFMADLLRLTGRPGEAIELAAEQRALLDTMVAHDPTNTGWARARAMGASARAASLMDLGRFDEAAVELAFARSEMDRLLEIDPSSVTWRTGLASVRARTARLELSRSRAEAAVSTATDAVELVPRDGSTTPVRAGVEAEALLLRGYAHTAVGRPEEADRDWRRALALLEAQPAESIRGELRPLIVEVLVALDRADETRDAVAALEASGYRAPALGRPAAPPNHP